MDLHSHLLPGLDDGAETMEETRRFARRLHAEGVLDIACTPHIKRAHFPRIDIAELAGRREAAQRAIEEDGIAVRLHPGGELADEDALELTERELALIAQGPEHAPWLLLECPFEGLDYVFDAAVARLTGLGYGLLLAHPERVRGPLDRLEPHVENGALLQVNVSSLLGEHGPQARDTGARLVRQGRAFCLAGGHAPGHAREHAPARLPGAGPLRRERDPGPAADRIQPALPAARGHRAPRGAAAQRRSDCVNE